jgi:hypothetical protein
MKAKKTTISGHELSRAVEQMASIMELVRNSGFEMDALAERAARAEAQVRRLDELEGVVSELRQSRRMNDANSKSIEKLSRENAELRASRQVDSSRIRELTESLHGREHQLRGALQQIRVLEQQLVRLAEAEARSSSSRASLEQARSRIAQLEGMNQSLSSQKEFLLQELEKRRSPAPREEWVVANVREAKA